MQRDNRGGAREGAGRKRLDNAILYCRMPQQSLAKLKQRAKDHNLAVGTYLVKTLDL